MRKVISLFLFLIAINFLIPNKKAYADNTIDFWSRSDYQEHIAFSYAVSFSTYELLHQKFDVPEYDALIYSTVGTLVLGAARDYFLFHHQNDMTNYMEANFVGATGASLIVLTFHF